MIVIIININTNSNLFMLWFQHYITLNIKFSIVIENVEKKKYNYIDNKFIIKREEINKDDVLLTENDFLFSYKKEDECMVLSKQIQNDEINKPQIIGRVFLVPVEDKPYYTTFEIPDFILYNHSDHTNYTKYGIKTGNEISKNLVCLSMKISDYAMDTEYYENNILFENNICEVVYKDYCYEILVNKDYKYGIIWNNKCASSTITKLFAYYNEIKTNTTHDIVYNFVKYRYNNYLQNIKTINFVRHPFLRFISCYFNKHIDKKDPEYLILDNYLLYLKQYKNQDTIINFAKFLKDGNVIDNHSANLSNTHYLNKYKNLKYENYDINKDINTKLDCFFKYHNKEKIIIVENYTNYLSIQYNIFFKKYTYDNWVQFKKINNNTYPCYNSIIDKELIDILKNIYKKDLIIFDYHNNIDLNIKHNLVPSNFKPELYREINPDLKKLTDVECVNHYIFYGINENRKYTIDFNKLPSNFDVYQYKYFNPDLQKMNNSQCINHYIEHGVNEKRKYKDNFFCKDYFCQKYNYKKTDDIYLKYINDLTQEKNSYFKTYIDTIKIDISQKYLLLVNHDNKCFGASHYLYLLYNLLKEKITYIQIILCEVNINDIILQNYNINKENVVEYKNDPTLLYLLYQKINPKIIYLNSCNDSIYNIHSYIPKKKCIYHSHEIINHYLLSVKLSPTFVVSERISKSYKYTMPLIQPPIISSIENIIELSNEPIEEIRNNFGIINTNKINIGMCGQITDRKNYKLFIEISILYPQYNFIWIGDNSNIFNNYSNIYHIKHTLNPYKYYKQLLDYFMLFSTADPCPYVVLENILLETPIITFRDNIYYDHKDETIKDIYNEYPSNINKHSAIDSINIYIKTKKTIKTEYGKQYIERNFTNINNIITKINELLTISK